jgi:hypothetical protein
VKGKDKKEEFTHSGGIKPLLNPPLKGRTFGRGIYGVELCRIV